jgi:hypothetical protein
MLLSLVMSAWASSNYPGELQAAVGVDCLPTCTVCHETAGGGSGTVIQDFGIAMMERGLTGGGNTDALTTAFDTLTADGVDSDGDGTADADELANGEDPNPDGEPFCDVVQPEYGCFNTSASPASLLGVLGGLLAVGVARRKR